MALFSYTAYDRDGSQIRGEIPAGSRDLALDALARKGWFPLSLDETAGASPTASVSASLLDRAPVGSSGDTPWYQRELLPHTTLPVAHLAVFTRELASLLASRLPIDECLRLIALQPMLPKSVRAMVRGLHARVSEGEALSKCLASQGATFPEYYWRLIEAGEASGQLEAASANLADCLEASDAMRSRVASALIYPTILVVAAIAAVAVVMSVLLPALAPLFDEAQVEAPVVIRVFSAVDVFVRDHGSALIVGGFGLLAVIVAVLRSQRLRRAIDRAMLSVPLVGNLIEKRETGRLARTLALLLSGGVGLVEAARVASAVMTNTAMANVVARAGQDVREGGTLSAQLAASELFSELFMRMLTIGEKTAQIDVMMSRAAIIYDATLSRQLQRIIGLITPVATLVIGVVVGTLMLSVMSALMSINDLALR